MIAADAGRLGLTGSPGRFTYNGNEFDDDYGFDLYYYGARYMDPALGRFTTPDPVKDFINPYSYVANNPMNLTDPTGMWGSVPSYNQGPMPSPTASNPFWWMAYSAYKEWRNSNSSQAEIDWKLSLMDDAEEDPKSSDMSEDLKRGDDLDKYGSLEDLENFIGPLQRPDENGYITFIEVAWWWRHGNGEPLYARLDLLDLSAVLADDFEFIGQSDLPPVIVPLFKLVLQPF